MQRRSIQFDWNQARAFLVTAEEGSLSAAARALTISQPTLSRQVAALEKEMGVALFERSAGGLQLTPNGLALIDHVRKMGDAASLFSLTATGKSEALEGNVCITATEVMATMILPSILVELREAQPGINLELVSSNETSDLRKREADIAIRAYRPNQGDLIAKKIGEDHYQLYASPSYLDREGRPRSFSDLNEHCFIGFDQSKQFISILNDAGLSLTTDNFPCLAESSLANWALVKAGAGIGVMKDTVGDAEPLVETVLPHLNFPKSELWLVSHRELRTNRRIKFVFDFLSDALKDYQ